MPAWKQQLRRDAAGEGHKLWPITRTTSKPKSAKLAELPNEYETGCTHCTLRVTASTDPGFRVRIEYRLGSRTIAGLGACTPARYSAANARYLANRQQAEKQQQQEEGSDAAA